MTNLRDDLAAFAAEVEADKAKRSRTRCGLCALPEARKAAVEMWTGGTPSTTISLWLKSRFNLDRAPRTIRDCLNKH